ncbi:MAG TPA: polyprenyl synthetase family protein [Ktedonobacterales bacterium]|nr:polyprenyl synthetase family protein [Ktedonobacterales bacterium]
MADTERIFRQPDITAVVGRYHTQISKGLRDTVESVRASLFPAAFAVPLLDSFYGQIEYHLGWRHPDLTRARTHPGKLLRPTLLLLGCELAAGSAGLDADARSECVRRAIPAAVCVELIHNFSLVHDDIEDGDEERRHRPTLWKLWGVPQAINTGDGIFSIARASLWRLVDEGVDPAAIVHLAALVDRTCIELCEGQFLDMTYEGRRDITVNLYLEMIERKTASLMACALEMGGILGAPQNHALAKRLAEFGRRLGMAFQLRDDLLGIWAREEELGKTAAGDLRRKKMSLPVIAALETARGEDLDFLSRMYTNSSLASDEQIKEALAILARTGARDRVRAALIEQGAMAREALDAAAEGAPDAREAHELLTALLDLVVAAAGDQASTTAT